MPKVVTLRFHSLYSEEQTVVLTCESVTYEPVQWGGRSGPEEAAKRSRDPSASVTLWGCDQADMKWERSSWTHVVWDEPNRGRLIADVRFSRRIPPDGLQFGVRDVRDDG